MIVMPGNATGNDWSALAVATGMIGHLYSPGAQVGPYGWFPYALDNGCFGLWDRQTNSFDEVRWEIDGLREWLALMNWARSHTLAPRWAIVPDRPGDWRITMQKWERYARLPEFDGIPRAVAVQDGATVHDVLRLDPLPDVVCVGGSTTPNGRAGWKWDTAPMWASSFPRVHMLRCNSPEKLDALRSWGYESCDGQGWNRGDERQTQGLVDYALRHGKPRSLRRTELFAKRKPPRRSRQGSLL